MNSIQFQQVRNDSMRFELLSQLHPGNAVRDVAVQHGLLFEGYPKDVALTAVLWDVDAALQPCDPSQRQLVLSQLKSLSDNQRLHAEDRQAIAQWLLKAERGAMPSVPSDLLATLHMINVGWTMQLDRAQRSHDQVEALLKAVKDQAQSSHELSRQRGLISNALFTLDYEKAKEAKLEEMVRDVHASDLPPSDQATLLGELSNKVVRLKPAKLAASGWQSCLRGLACIAEAHPADRALSARLRDVVHALLPLEGVRYPSNPMIELQSCRLRMNQAGYPEVAMALYVTAAAQMASVMKKPVDGCVLAFSELLRQITEAAEAGHRVPLDQVKDVLAPAIRAWPEQDSTGRVTTRWRDFLNRGDFCSVPQ